MRTLVHISDIHFGREDPVLVDALRHAIAGARPDIIVISGDLTQRARVAQFQQAQAFLKSLPPVPQIVVPGNHDISTTNLLRRVASPLSRYRRYISNDLAPFFADDEIALAGVNTVRALAVKDGRINRRQVEASCARFQHLDPAIIRILITHHPMDLPASNTKDDIVTRARMAMSRFAACRVDLFLSGHLHTVHTVATSARYNFEGYSGIVAQAGTAVSTRTRGEANSWNLIHIEQTRIRVQQIIWDPGVCSFVPGKIETYLKLPTGWTLQPA